MPARRRLIALMALTALASCGGDGSSLPDKGAIQEALRNNEVDGIGSAARCSVTAPFEDRWVIACVRGSGQSGRESVARCAAVSDGSVSAEPCDPLQSEPPPEISLDVEPEAEAGRNVAMQSGCLACHTFAENGNAGPGPDLTHVGTRLTRSQIENVVARGPGIMPAYQALREHEPERFAALTLFLSQLKMTDLTCHARQRTRSC